MLRRLTTFLAGLAAALTISLAAPAAEYPTRPVTVIVAFTPGGPSDVLARIIGRRLQDILHQPFIIENRPGSGGNIAAEQTAHATPDGYTLLMGNNSILATNAALYKKLAYDPETDFIPISLIGTQANILVVNPAVQANSMAELIALIKSGKVRALAVTTPKRTALLPDLPTVDELGIKGFDATTWHGLVAPAGTPKEIVDTLNFATLAALKDPDTQKALIDLGVDIIGNSPKEFEAYIKTEIPKWTAVVKQSGAQID